MISEDELLPLEQLIHEEDIISGRLDHLLPATLGLNYQDENEIDDLFKRTESPRGDR